MTIAQILRICRQDRSIDILSVDLNCPLTLSFVLTGRSDRSLALLSAGTSSRTKNLKFTQKKDYPQSLS